MKVYVTSIGEITTDICCQELKRYDFDVVLLGAREKWIDKYKRFIKMATGACLRIDADVIVNKNIRPFWNSCLKGEIVLSDCQVYDFYKNGLSYAGVVFYSQQAIDFIKKNIDKISNVRPERSMTILLGNNKCSSSWLVGVHGFYQDFDTFLRAKVNKQTRGQLEEYDFRLAGKLMRLWN